MQFNTWSWSWQPENPQATKKYSGLWIHPGFETHGESPKHRVIVAPQNDLGPTKCLQKKKKKKKIVYILHETHCLSEVDLVLSPGLTVSHSNIMATHIGLHVGFSYGIHGPGMMKLFLIEFKAMSLKIK